MQNEFISIGKFIDNICKTVQANDHKGVVGYILRKYDLFDISLYQKSKNDKEIILANPITTEVFYDYMRETYPPKPTDKTESYNEILLLRVSMAKTVSPFDLNLYLWKAEDFYQKAKDFNQLFNDMPVERITIPPNLESLNRTITELKQDASNKDDEITHLQAHIEKLNNQLQETGESLNANSQKTISKLLYALLREHGYVKDKDNARKGAINDQLRNLTERYNVPISREAIAKWLDCINEIGKMGK
ncbi:MAG: hypothetical protein ACTTGU_01590 [Moraxella sp.]|jgi:hypothetical protein